jgi:hypothetical protein
MRLAPITTIEYLKAAGALAGNHHPGMAIAQSDLPDWPACGVQLAQNDCRPGIRRHL